jgi:tetratricopeptide (TPR) repeat protein
MISWRTAFFGWMAVMLAGCATTKPSSSWSRTGDPVVDGKRAIAQGPAKDRVLWQYRTAATAMRLGRFEEAKALLDDALLSIGGISAGDKSARRARGYFSEEARKNFRGEPYERVMAYYYRGILYWMDGEPDNARACFRSAQFEDSDAEEHQYASDYVLLEYLDGLATVKLGGDGSDAFQRAAALSNHGTPPPYDPAANALFFVEFGQGPTKYATGQYREQLRFHTAQSPIQAARIRTGERSFKLSPYDDLNFQATTRGGRVMDHILANQAVFKSATDTAGNVALISGAVLAHNRQTEAGLGLLAFGLASKIVSAATTPAADTRSWDNLPQHLSFAALELPPGAHEVTVEFLDAGGKAIPSLTKHLSVQIEPGRDMVVFISDKSQQHLAL